MPETEPAFSSPIDLYNILFERRTAVLDKATENFFIGDDEIFDALADMNQLAVDARAKFGSETCKEVASYHVACGSTFGTNPDFPPMEATLKRGDFSGEDALVPRVMILLDKIDNRVDELLRVTPDTPVPDVVIEEDPMKVHPTETEVVGIKVPRRVEQERVYQPKKKK